MAENGLNTLGESKGNAGRFLIPLVLFLQLTVAVASLTFALRGPGLDSLWLGLLVGLVLAWSLAILHQPAFKSVILMVLVGFLFILLVPGGLGGRLAAIGQGGAHWILGLFPFYTGEKIDIFQLVILVRNLSYSLFVLVQRSQVWIKALSLGKPAFDPLAATLAWNGLVWIVAIWAGWIVEARQNALLSIFPSVLLSLGTLSLGQHMYNGQYVMLGLTLLLLAIVQQTRRQQNWISGRIAFPAHKGKQIIKFALFVTLLVVILSASLSSLSVQSIRQWIDELRNTPVQQQNSLAQSLGILPGGTPFTDRFQPVRSPGLPREHLIGSGPELSSRVMMTVKVNNLAALSIGNQPLPLYWRGFTYDIYTGHGWSSSVTKEYTMAANAELQAGHAQGHLAILEEFFPVESLGETVYAAGEPVKVGTESEAAWRSSDDLFGIQIATNSPYEVVSLVPVADEATLRQSGENYPDWVRQRFLTLPAEVPERVKVLAIRLTETGITPYDRAVAIEDYLRTYPYNLDVPIPPAQHDITDYFLFDLKKGYCDYFATSMVVLSRLAGIPARLAIGYATGTYNLNSNRFSVSEADAHSWAELYFPGIGWIPFEATPAYPALDRQLPLPGETPSPAGNSPSQSTRLGKATNLLWFAVPGLVIAFFAVLGVIWFSLTAIRLFLLPQPLSEAEIYQKLKRMAIRLGAQLESGNTPYEFLAAFSSALTNLTSQGLPISLITRLKVDIQVIIDAIVQNRYQIFSYSGRPIIRAWLGLRQRLWLVWVLRKFGRFANGRHSQTGSING